ncbi:hypothetical protein CEXT_285501 [Caerostris extrusa]|uniref:Uncharacterized protein n=1 Tax=Caerostris extrusa TaxID=172846 RepID=A0AAV4VB24_CAEEX|nr:hypothetical protein CEXT_285501 [Caerostris extrusa]
MLLRKQFLRQYLFPLQRERERVKAFRNGKLNMLFRKQFCTAVFIPSSDKVKAKLQKKNHPAPRSKKKHGAQ